MTGTISDAPIGAKRPAAEMALAITGRPYVSWSQISTMRSCPAKFLHRYVQQVRPDFVASSLRYGGAVHAAIETFFCGMLEGIELGLPELHHAFRQAWAEPQEADVPLKFCKGETPASLDDLAGRMLGAFLASPLSRPSGRIIAVEETIQTMLAEDLPDVLARVDMIWRDDAGMHLIDYKTSRSSWNEAKVAESAEQLVLYRHAAGKMIEDSSVPIHLAFGVLTKHKTPRAQLLEVPSSAIQLERTVEGIRQVWAAVEAGNFYPSPSGMNCATCPYKSRCPAFVGK